jgi:23S rRNA (guanosine2251-2'-O)-methyltransferase
MSTKILFGFHAVTVRPEDGAAQSVPRSTSTRRAATRACASSSPARAAGVRLIDSDEPPGRLAGTPRHQGVVARGCAAAAAPLAGRLARRHGQGAPLLLVLDGVTDPHNLGACLRVADGAGAHAVVAPKDHAVGLNATVAKVASGAAETVPYLMVTNLARTLGELKERDIRVIGTSDDAEQTLYEADLRGPVALVLGAEGAGHAPADAQDLRRAGAHPDAGRGGEPERQVAAGVCLYEALRQRQRVCVLSAGMSADARGAVPVIRCGQPRAGRRAAPTAAISCAPASSGSGRCCRRVRCNAPRRLPRPAS